MYMQYLNAAVQTVPGLHFQVTPKRMGGKDHIPNFICKVTCGHHEKNSSVCGSKKQAKADAVKRLVMDVTFQAFLRKHSVREIPLYLQEWFENEQELPSVRKLRIKRMQAAKYCMYPTESTDWCNGRCFATVFYVCEDREDILSYGHGITKDEAIDQAYFNLDTVLKRHEEDRNDQLRETTLNAVMQTKAKDAEERCREPMPVYERMDNERNVSCASNSIIEGLENCVSKMQAITKIMSYPREEAQLQYSEMTESSELNRTTISALDNIAGVFTGFKERPLVVLDDSSTLLCDIEDLGGTGDILCVTSEFDPWPPDIELVFEEIENRQTPIGHLVLGHVLKRPEHVIVYISAEESAHHCVTVLNSVGRHAIVLGSIQLVKTWIHVRKKQEIRDAEELSRRMSEVERSLKARAYARDPT